jgi:hypothetical protein
MNLKRISVAVIQFLMISAVIFACPALSQPVIQKKATLSNWKNNLRLFALDRSDNYGGFYYDRGLFRMHTPEMSPEYRIDLNTYFFSPFEDYLWAESENGFRSVMGSLSTPVFAVRSEFKNVLEISSGNTFTISAFQQEDLQARRGLFIIGYNHRLGESHTLGIEHTLSNKKTDLDVSLHYTYQKEGQGKIAAEIAILDWANNLVTGLSAERQNEFEIRHEYLRKPYLFSLHAESPKMGLYRGELLFAFQPKSRAEVVQRELPDQNFILSEHFSIRGALFEMQFAGGSTGIIYQHTVARMTRNAASASEYPLDFGNRQEVLRGGFYLTYQWRDFGLEQWLWIERNRDHQFDNNPEAYALQDPYVRSLNRYPFTFNELRRFNKTKLFYRPDEQLIGFFAEHNGDWRTPEFDGRSETVAAISYRSYYPNHIVARNERLTFGVDLRFSERTRLTLGASIDLDEDLYNGFGLPRDDPRPAFFDGGFGRLLILW